MSYQNDSAIAACNRIERDLRSGGLDDEADGAATCVAELQHLGGRADGAFCETTPCECDCHARPPTRPVTLANPEGDFDPDAPEPGDTAALMRLRACIDEDGVWATRQHKEEGDYEGCVRFMAEEIRRLQNCVTQAERSRYSATTLAAQAHFTAKRLAELTEPAARLYELDRSLEPIRVTQEMLEELKRQGR